MNFAIEFYVEKIFPTPDKYPEIQCLHGDQLELSVL